MECSKCLQSAVGDLCRLSTPESHRAGRPPMGVIFTTTGCFYGLLSSGSAESGSDPTQRDAALPAGPQGEQIGNKHMTSSLVESYRMP